jgi:hypothetical protein
LAREQIEQLMHGRDRLMQAFERARVVAVDVVAELKPLGEPDEYVNLSPTTGPVPVMVPNSRRPAERPELLEVVRDADVIELVESAGATENEVVAEPTAAFEPVLVEELVETGDDADTGAEVVDEVAVAEVVDEVAVDDATVDDVADQPVDDGNDTVPEAAEVDTSGADTPDTSGAHLESVGDETTAEVADDVETTDTTPDEAASGVAGGDDRDDVVVDLFARLRAESAPTVDATIDTAAADATVVTGLSVVGELDDDRSDAPSTEAPGEIDGAVGLEVADSPFRRRDAELTPLIVSSARKLKRVLADEQNDVLDRLRRSEPVRTIDQLLPTRDEHVDTFAVAIDAELRSAASAGAASVATGRAAKLGKSAMAEAVGAGRMALAEWLVNPLRDRLDRCVADGAGDNDAIARSIRSIYREWKTQHIDDQLDDVLRAAHGRAVLAALPAGAPVCWGVDAEHPACADGDDNALAGRVAAGQPFPTGHLFAPSHVGCRCLLVPTDQ